MTLKIDPHKKEMKAMKKSLLSATGLVKGVTAGLAIAGPARKASVSSWRTSSSAYSWPFPRVKTVR